MIPVTRAPAICANPVVRHLLVALLASGSAAFAGSANYDFNDNTLPAGDELRGTATVTNGELELTTATNTQAASYVFHNLDPGQYVSSFSASFKLFMGGGTNPPADGTSFSFGQLPAGTFTEGGLDADTNNFTLSSGLTVSFDSYGGNDTNQPGFGPGIEIDYGGRRLYTIASASLPGGTVSTGSYVPVSVSWSSASGLSLTYNGQSLVTGLKLVRSQPGNGAFQLGSQFGFGARTGGLNENHFVDDVQISTVAQIAPLTLNGRVSGTIAGGSTVVAYNSIGTPNMPGAEQAPNVLDDSITTKYLNFTKTGAGVIITPALVSGQTGFQLDGFVLTAANDAPERDPANYVLEGSNDGLTWDPISASTLPAFGNRFWSQEVDFPLTANAYSQFRLYFPNVVNDGTANSMQIGEIELLGQAVPEPSVAILGTFALASLALRRRRPVTTRS